MSRNSLYMVIGVLAVIVVAAGIYIATQQAQEPRLEIRVDENGLSVDGNG